MTPTLRANTTRRIVGALAFTALTFGAVVVPAQAAPSPASPAAVVPVTTTSAQAAIRSNDYPANTWGASANYRGILVLTPAPSTDAVGLAYSWKSADDIPVATSADSLSDLPRGWKKTTKGEVRLTQPKGTSGPKTLYVKMFNNKLEFIGKTAEYSYYVSPTIPGGGVNRVEAEKLKTTVTVRTAAGKTYGKGSLTFKESDTPSSTGGRRHLLATGGNATYGPEFALSFKTSVTSNYSLGVSLAKAKNFGKLRFFVVDSTGKRTALLDPNTHKAITFDGYATTAQRIHLPLGGLKLSKGTHQLVVKVVGRNPASVSKTLRKVADHGYAGAVDFLTVAPLG